MVLNHELGIVWDKNVEDICKAIYHDKRDKKPVLGYMYLVKIRQSGLKSVGVEVLQ
jgi:hypothetical protein